MANNFFQRMCKDAMDELAEGNKGWKDTETNTLIMACFGMLYNHLAHRITKPLWFVAWTVAGGVLTHFVLRIIGI